MQTDDPKHLHINKNLFHISGVKAHILTLCGRLNWFKNYVQYFEGKENRIARENPIPKSKYSDIFQLLVRYRGLGVHAKYTDFCFIIFVLFGKADTQYCTVLIHTCVAHLPILNWTQRTAVASMQNALRIELPREYWRIHRGPGFLAVVCFGSSPTPSLTCQQIVFSFSVFRVQLTDGRGGRVGEEPNHTTAIKPGPL
jgi:hypothetical protein